MSIEKSFEDDQEARKLEEQAGLYAKPDGTIITESERKDEEKRKKEDPNWYREQK